MRLYAIIFSILVMLVNCKDIEPPDLISALLTAGTGRSKVGIVSSDLSGTGRFTVMNQDGLVSGFYTPVHSDAVARYTNNQVYVMNRLGRDSILVLNPDAAYTPVAEYSTGSGSNPHDIAVVNEGLAYISLYERTYLLQIDPRSGAVYARIELGQFAETVSAGGAPDGLPEIDQLHLYENSLFVTVQRLDRNHPVFVYAPTEVSYLLELDARSGALIAAHRMQFVNPFSKIKRIQFQGTDRLAVSSPGYLGFNFQIDGGIEVFDLSSRSFTGYLYTEQAAGGDILDFVFKNDVTGYALVQYADFSISLQRFNPSTGQRVSELAFYPASGGYISGLLLGPDGKLYAGDSSVENPGIRIYDTNAGDLSLTALPVSTGLRPVDLIYISD